MQKCRTLALAIVLASLSSLTLAKTQKVVLNIPTMDCATCPITIKTALKKVPGVSSAKVSYEKREAVVVFDDQKTNVDSLKKATADAGYPAMVK
jgi:periplasmic mercuric ion binding protein